MAAVREFRLTLSDGHRLVSVRRAALRAGVRLVAVSQHRAQHLRHRRQAGPQQPLQIQRRVETRR